MLGRVLAKMRNFSPCKISSNKCNETKFKPDQEKLFVLCKKASYNFRHKKMSTLGLSSFCHSHSQHFLSPFDFNIVQPQNLLGEKRKGKFNAVSVSLKTSLRMNRAIHNYWMADNKHWNWRPHICNSIDIHFEFSMYINFKDFSR